MLSVRTQEALHKADEVNYQFDLLLTDVVMPEMNGREVYEEMQKQKHDLKALFMSGYTANVIADRGVIWKGVNFIHKPFSKQGLGLKLREVLSGKKGAE